jgi:glycerophosphoryl diester phosphodiesterase
MKYLIMDKLQFAFDLVYGLFPRQLAGNAVEPLLVGHRGVYEHPEVLENTLAAFDIAIAHGGGLEFDLHLTRDNVVVVHHDATLLRVHRLPHAVRELTLHQLQELAPAVPTLDEVLQRYGHSCPHYFMEPKVRDQAGMETLLQAVGVSLKQARLDGVTTLISTDHRMLDAARRLVPWLAKAVVFFVNHRGAVEYVQKHGDTGLAGWYFTYPASLMNFLEQRGLHIGVGQIDYGNTHRHYCNRGFRYHFTNRIDRLVKPVEPLTLPVFSPTLVGAPG